MKVGINIGKTYGELTVLGKDDSKKNYYKCKCNKGHIVSVRKDHLNSDIKCKVCRVENAHVGEVINGITIVRYDGSDKFYNKYYIFRCFCGNEFRSIYSEVHNGHTRSCGCLKNKYGDMSKDNRYRNWSAMVQRTTNKNHKAYKHYHDLINGKVIEDSWVKSPKDFFDEIGEKPGPSYTIDRIDNSKGYIVGNVKWSSRQEQQMNRYTERGVTGEKYIYYDKRRDKYTVYHPYPYGRKFVGQFDTLSDAKQARDNFSF